MICSHPRQRRDVGEVPGILVSVRGEASEQTIAGEAVSVCAVNWRGTAEVAYVTAALMPQAMRSVDSANASDPGPFSEKSTNPAPSFALLPMIIG